ncbi:MAG TPA: AbrB/MazE/SpoVT family DNA-binding domain-containing protein [Candidatus Nanoarchaeia archaeon]|nr:AbrB/MazE/SpoVT family DNA-binding domain-containing protein [Candidatus Nanoarchaeia archaeon]
MIVTISKGLQITIPSDIRNHLGLEVGSKVEIEEKNGNILIKPIEEDVEEVFREAKNVKPKHNLTVRQMKELNQRMFR